MSVGEVDIMKKQQWQGLCSGVLALSLGWLTACAPQHPGAVAPQPAQNTSAPANASAALLRQGRPQHPNPNHPRNRQLLQEQQSQPLPAYFAEMETEYGVFSTLALSAGYLERKVRTLVDSNNGEAMRREIAFGHYKHPQLLIDLMLSDPALYTAAAAMPEVVAFRSANATFDSFMLALAGQSPVAQEFQINSIPGNQYIGWVSKGVAMDAQGNFVVAYNGEDNQENGIYARLYHATGSPQGLEFLVNSNPNSSVSEPAVAMADSGDFVVTWLNDQHIYARRYNSNGTPKDSDFQISTNTEGSNNYPHISLDTDGDFIVSWTYYSQGAQERNIHARRYNSGGVALDTPEFQVNSNTEGYMRFPRAVLGNDGAFIIAWTRYTQDWNDADVFARRYDATGAPLAPEFQLNSTTDPAIYPDLALDSSGDFVVTWTRYNADWDDADIYARRYDATGNPKDGSEFLVNTHTENVQNLSDIAMDQDGNFVIAWNSYDADWDNPQVYARRYQASGTAQGSAFRVNTSTDHVHAYPSVAMAADGDFVVAWNRYESEWNNPSAIYGMRYNAAGEPQITP